LKDSSAATFQAAVPWAAIYLASCAKIGQTMSRRWLRADIAEEILKLFQARQIDCHNALGAPETAMARIIAELHGRDEMERFLLMMKQYRESITQRG
jgi:hypothetical protein